MPPNSEKKNRGRGKRPRDPSRDERPVQFGFTNLNHTTAASSSSSPSASFEHHSVQARTGFWPGAAIASSASASQPGHPGSAITSYAPPGKVAIPALRQPQSFESSAKGSKKSRTSHACDACRKAKAGCNGEQPCARCKNSEVDCVYGDGKREHDRKMMKRLTQESTLLNQRNTDITDALRRIQLDSSLSQRELRAAIDEIIAMKPISVSPDCQGSFFGLSRSSLTAPEEAKPSINNETDEEEDDDDDDDDDDDEVGSMGSVDIINVDTDRDDTRATGHMGKTSAVSWAKRTNEEMRRSNLLGNDNATMKLEPGHTLASYHVEDADVEYFDTSSVNSYGWPEHNVADTLVKIYFDNTHQAFPVLNRAKFMERYVTFQRGATNLNASDLIWLGTLNLVFAISAVFGDLADLENEGHGDDHMVYCARAKLLCVDQRFLFQDARLSTTSFLGLMSLYYVSLCKLNRAWTLCGLAIREGLTLGLNIRSEVRDLSDVEKEHRVRLWWSLYALEVLLNELTGRPSCIHDRDISTPLPINIGEDDFARHPALYQNEDSGHSAHAGSSGRRASKSRPPATYEVPNGYLRPLALSFPIVELPVSSSTYFIYRTQLSIISHEIVTQLYCAATIKEKWTEIQGTIKTIETRLLSWRDSLPTELNILFETWNEPDWSDPYTLPRIALAISFNSSRMILCRPCLCRVDRRTKNQTQASRDFEQEAAERCIRSARRIISLLKWSARSESQFYAISPWWNTLHYLCEALSVLMLEMAFEVEHIPAETAGILADAKEGVFWLAMLSAGSIAARKAWEIFDNLIRVVATKIKWSVMELPTNVPVPARYNWQRFGKPNSAQPWNSLSHERLREHQASQAAFQDPTVAWTNQGLEHYVTEQPEPEPEQSGNQLSRAHAIETFTSMSQLYGHYDEPWQQLFMPTTMTPPISGMGQLSEDALQLSGQQMPGLPPQMGAQLGTSQFSGSMSNPSGGSHSGVGRWQPGELQSAGSQAGGSKLSGSLSEPSRTSHSGSPYGVMGRPTNQLSYQGELYHTQASFDGNVPFETSSRTYVDQSQQRRESEQQQEEDMQEIKFSGFGN